MLKTIAICLHFCIYSAIHAALNEPVRISSGLVQGAPAHYLNGSSISVFRSIPYAASPVGELRWRPQQPAAVWDGVYNASHSEERRPVYVWFFGAGSSNQDALYDGEGLAQQGLVVVVPNYRSFIVGKLAHPALSAESGLNISGNYGVLDQIFALQWVKENIAAFGGDPHKVTIGGESAGSAAVLRLLFAPQAKGLFRAVVSESGMRYARDPVIASVASGYLDLVSAELLGLSYASSQNCSTLECLRALPFEQLGAGISISASPYKHCVDGHAFPRLYFESLTQGLHPDVPVLAGNKRDESGASVSPNLTVMAYKTAAAAKYAGMVQQFLELYPAQSDAQAGNSSNAAFQDNSKVGTYLWAEMYKSRANSPVWTYYWTHAPPGQDQGAYHMSEINYFFNNLYGTDRPWTADDFAIGRTLSGYLVNFVTHLDPNGGALPEWPKTDRERPAVMHLGDNVFEGGYPVATEARYQFFKKFFETQRAW